MIENISQRLFSKTPHDTLYHYTSLTGLLGIVSTGELRASDVRYMNDSAELRHTLDLLSTHVTRRIVAGVDNPALLDQFLEWLSHRIISGSMLFSASFRENGNLLSQWRGYSGHGKGVSLGFNPRHLLECARKQEFQVAKCLYDKTEQSKLVEQIINSVEALAKTQPTTDISPEAPSWDHIFEQMEGDLLRIAAILKHPSFEEEQEWRLVSPVIGDCHGLPVHFREGHSMLVPYYAFDLAANVAGGIQLEHVFVGPTSNIDLSMNSISMYLCSCGIGPARGVSYCQIPYRQR